MSQFMYRYMRTSHFNLFYSVGFHGYDRVVVGLIIFNDYDFHICTCRGVLNTTYCSKECQLFTGGQLFLWVLPVYSTNKADLHDITDALLKVAL